jgi:SAM-dependent methyltransferase
MSGNVEYRDRSGIRQLHRDVAWPSTLNGSISNRRTLNLGSGRKKIEGAVNVDLVGDTSPDLVHNLNCLPWPLPSGQFDKVVARDVIEHLDNIVEIMEEIHRVCRPNAVLDLTVPHFSCSNAFTDPTHRHYFGLFSFNYFTGENEFPFYTKAKFRRVSTQLCFLPTLMNKLVMRLANRYPRQYERRWAWLFPGWFLHFELEIVKDLQ